jgi:hypothetical protein
MNRSKTMRLMVVALVAILCSACGTVTKKREFSPEQIDAELLSQRQSMIETEFAQRQRVADQIFPYAVAALPDCPKIRGYVTGIDLGGIGAIATDFADGAKGLGIGFSPTVITVAKNSPANQAGILPGDLLLAINGAKDWKEGPDAYQGATEALQKAVSQGVPIRLSFTRKGKPFESSVTPVPACRVDAIITRTYKPEPRANASAALFPYHVVRLASTPGELAALTAFSVASVVKEIGVSYENGDVSRPSTRKYVALTRRNDNRLVVADVSIHRKEIDDTDAYAAELMRRTGGDPDEIPKLWRKMKARKMLSDKDQWGSQLSSLERMTHLDALSKAR